MERNNSTGGIGFVGALQLLFIALKLLEIIDWTWVWVLAPTWISLLLVLIVVAVIFIVTKIVDRHKF